MNDCSAVRSGAVTPNQLNTAIAKSIANAKATARQRHRSMACQIRRRTVSDIVGLGQDKTPRQSIEVAIDLSSIAQTAFYTTKPDGMGMGLSICRSIIEALGGRLWATRCEPRGALFQFTVPAD
jgi:C4-dicarboxylate-specific signal transduction histidine kinase